MLVSFRDALCVNKATSRTQGLDFAAGAEFIRTYFLEESKVMAEELASGVREAFKELVTESTWMDSDTQVNRKAVCASIRKSSPTTVSL